MRPKLATRLTQEICTLYRFSPLVHSLLPKDALLRTYCNIHSRMSSQKYPFNGVIYLH